MSDQDALSGVDETTITPVEIGGAETFRSPSSAARALADFREKQQQKTPDASADPATPVDESAQADATPPEEATGETKEADPVEPSIELPRSWAKDRHDAWAKLDRATQQYLLEHDREASAAVRKSQNEAAEVRKAVEAERVKVEQARQQYETALPQLLQTLQAQYAGQFPDVRSMADVERLAAEDWPRYMQWDVQQKKMAAVQQEFLTAQQREAEEKITKFSEYAREQDKAFREAIPDIADPKKAAEIEKKAIKTLSTLGFENSELVRAWAGQGDISLRDARMQQLIHKAALWDDAQAKAKTAVAKSLPPVQRPGVGKPPGAQAEADHQALKQRLAQTGNIRDAVRLRTAQLRESAR